MHASVPYQIITLSESFPAIGAQEGSFCRVSPLVIHQMHLLLEAHPARVTRVRAFSVVGEQVLLQSAFRLAFLATYFTLYHSFSRVQLAMSEKADFGFENFAADVASIILQMIAVCLAVHVLAVLVKGSLTTEAFITNLTKEALSRDPLSTSHHSRGSHQPFLFMEEQHEFMSELI